MHANWYGVLPRWVRQKFGHVGTEMIGGIVGSEQEHHSAPYAITEEFVSVYRLHPLLPDDYAIRSHENGELVDRARVRSDPGPRHPADDRSSSVGRTSSTRSVSTTRARSRSATTRRPSHNHVRLNGDRVDLGTLDILRDRERGVPRYNDFREKLAQVTDRDVRGPDRRSRAGRGDPRRLRRRHRPGRPAGRAAGRAAAPGLRVQRYGIPDLHPDGLAHGSRATASSPTTTRPRSTRRRASTGSRTTR